MLTQLDVFTSGITTPPLPIVDGKPATDPFQIRKIDGLGPVKADINTDKYGSIDGEYYRGGFTGKRNIVLTVGLRPNWANQSVESLRAMLYDYFLPQNDIKLKFTSTDRPQVQIAGYVESCEVNPFSRDPEVQVSIICPQPYFTAVAATAVSGTTLAFGDTTTTDINYLGDAEVGAVIDVTSTDTADFTGEIRYFNKNSSGTKIIIEDGGTLNSTNLIRISTVRGDKYARQIPLPNGTPINLLGKISPGSSWFTLRKGINKFQVLSENPGYSWSLSYFTRYGGL